MRQNQGFTRNSWTMLVHYGLWVDCGIWSPPPWWSMGDWTDTNTNLQKVFAKAVKAYSICASVSYRVLVLDFLRNGMSATMCNPIRASRGRHVRLQHSAVCAVSITFSRVHLPQLERVLWLQSQRHLRSQNLWLQGRRVDETMKLWCKQEMCYSRYWEYGLMD